MRILFTTTPGSGHFNPMIPLARAMTARGHQVTFASSPAWTPEVEAAGFRNIGCGPTWRETMTDPVMQEILRKDFFVELGRMGMVEDVVRAARSIDADLIAYEGAEVGGLLASAILGIPCVQASAAAGKMWWQIMQPKLATLAAEQGLDSERVASMDFPLVYVDRTPPTLETPGFVPYRNLYNARPEIYEHPSEMPSWADKLGNRPIVYVTLGTVFSNPQLFKLLAGAFAGEPVDVVLATGGAFPLEALGELPPNVHAGGYLPQSKLVARAEVVVAHGGYNTVISAMTYGVPMYVIPIEADQPYNASRLVAAGAAISAPVQEVPPGTPRQFTPPEPAAIRDAVRRLLGESSFKEAAGRVRAEIAAMPPVSSAVEHIEMAQRGAAATMA